MSEPSEKPSQKTEEEIDREWELESIEMRKGSQIPGRPTWREVHEQFFQVTGQLPGHGVQF